MTPVPQDLLHLAETDAAHRVAALPVPYADMFGRGDVSVELFAPRGVDTQTPHTRDELYIVSSGSGTFRRGDETCEFATGDLLFVPAHVEHRFERFSDDFRTWVIFFGPEGGVRL